MRLFIALEVPEALRENLASVQTKLRAPGTEFRWVRPENFHVTLKFIGGASREELEGITEVLRAVRPDGAVKADFRGLGHYWNAKRGGVFWATMEASDGLKQLARQINLRLSHLGMPADERPFLPHLTLARFKRGNALPVIRAALNEYSGREFGSMQAEEFHLMESQLGRGGSKYTTLQSFPFAKSANA